MQYGFVKVAAITPEIRVADCAFNAQSIVFHIKEAQKKGIEILCLPELCITGSTCGDLFLQPSLLDGALISLEHILKQTQDAALVYTVGLPLLYKSKRYDCMAVCQSGKVLGIVPKGILTRENTRVFAAATASHEIIHLFEQPIPFGTDLLFQAEGMPAFSFSVLFGDELCASGLSVVKHAAAGATLLCCSAALPELAGQAQFVRTLIQAQSAQNLCALVYSNAGNGESTTDVVYAGHGLAAEKGVLLSESQPFSYRGVVTDIDVEYLVSERSRSPFYAAVSEPACVPFRIAQNEKAHFTLSRKISAFPFIPEHPSQQTEQCRQILDIQAAGLAKRLSHTHAKTALIGISGGLDSTLALLAVVKTFRQLKRPLSDIIAVTMPCFGTTERTRSNAQRLCDALGVSMREVNITKTVQSNFGDIGQDETTHDVTFENTQARVRTLVLMNLANRMNGLVIGTGDLSELALGWATYNGDHMSMYGVNASVPKTLLRYIVSYVAEECGDEKLRSVLLDILDTPVSPELLPAKDGKISQQTEELVGPYELHDFFLYYAIRRAYRPAKIYFLAQQAFAGMYSNDVLLKWLRNFYHRFVSQQFKRSCLPDGPKVGTVSFSPRGDLFMPSDACAGLWLNEVDALKE